MAKPVTEMKRSEIEVHMAHCHCEMKEMAKPVTEVHMARYVLHFSALVVFAISQFVSL